MLYGIWSTSGLYNVAYESRVKTGCMKRKVHTSFDLTWKVNRYECEGLVYDEGESC